MVGIIYYNKQNINQLMIKHGYAWVYDEYCKKSVCKRWHKLQKKAKNRQRGLWYDDYPVRPKYWRKYKEKNER